jgi:hypothetical protein
MVAFGPSWLFLQRNNSHRSTSFVTRRRRSVPPWSDMKREHYGNFSVAEMVISRREAANGNLACPLASTRQGASARELDLPREPVCIGDG